MDTSTKLRDDTLLYLVSSPSWDQGGQLTEAIASLMKDSVAKNEPESTS